MRRLLIIALLVAGCNGNAANQRDAIQHVVSWSDPEHPVICYAYDDYATGSQFDCVYVPE